MSYAPNILDACRQVGIYVGKILGALIEPDVPISGIRLSDWLHREAHERVKAADLPIVRGVKIDLVLNMQTAKALGITFPPSLLAPADEVIE
jgi:putative tryptophan/tyrosine transport system substrate-binding protein